MEKTKRKLKRKSEITIEGAAKEVITNKVSIRSVAKKYDIAKSQLARLVKQAKLCSEIQNFRYKPNIGNRRVFSSEEETSLVKYLKLSSKMAYGLSYVQTRKLAYEYVCNLNKTIPAKWEKDKIASLDWLKSFMSRHPDLVLRRPEKTSLGRATAFNKSTVEKFFTNLQNVMERFKFPPQNIFNADETGLCTVTDLPKVIAERGTKQVAQATSAERGELVTMLAFSSAVGSCVPPVFIFPRVRYREFMLKDCPPGSLGLSNKSGWMTKENFLLSLKHFVKHVKCSSEDRVLLLIDNHESHVNLEVVIYAKENGVVILTLPPHTSHKLQPLDVSVFGPFKTFYKVAMNDWMLSHPGQTVTIYQLPQFANIAYTNAFSIKNITSGFRKTGIYPLNSNNFGDDDFLTSYVTDHPDNDIDIEKEIPNTTPDGTQIDNKVDDNEPSTSFLSVEEVRPYPKAPPRKQKTRGRKKGSTKILTDTGEKDILEQEQIKKAEKQRNSNIKQKKSVKRKLMETSSSSSEENLEDNIKYADSDASVGPEVCSDEDITDTEINVNDYVLTKLCSKKTINYAVGIVLKILDKNEFNISFLKKSNQTNGFIYPEPADVADVSKHDIIMKLPLPHNNSGTKRASCFYYFDIDLTKFVGLL